LKLLLKIISLTVLFTIPITLLILPSNFFDSGNSICMSVLFFDTECYGCGMTRAVMHFIHFNFTEAMTYNKLVILVLPLLILGWLKIVLSLFGKKILKWF